MSTFKRSFFVFALTALACLAQTSTSTGVIAGTGTISRTADITWANPFAGGSGTISSGVVWANSPAFSTATNPGVIQLANGATFRKGDKAIKPTHFTLKAADLADGQYAALARSVGANGAAEEAEILAAINSLGLKVYDEEAVGKYLIQTAVNAGHWSWAWKPVRDDDSTKVFQARRDGSSLLLDSRVYSRAIPAPILEVAANMGGKVPNAIFLVSDYEDRKPDPFLAVTTERMLMSGRIWIIAEWDEPGFGVPTPAKTEVLLTAALPVVH